MQSVTELSSARQPRMVMTLSEQVRQQVRQRIVHKIAELLLQADKGSESMRLGDLRCKESRQAYRTAALLITDGEAREERLRQVNVADAQLWALRSIDDEEARLQARADILKYGPSVKPGHCQLCAERIVRGTDGVKLFLSENIVMEAHDWCAKRSASVEPTVGGYAVKTTKGVQ